MRYLTIISMTLLLSACGNKLSTLKYTGETVSQTISACKETAQEVCTKLEKIGNLSAAAREGAHEKAMNSWDTHMMLW